MDSLALLSGLCSNSKIPSLPNPSLDFSSSSSSKTFVQSQNWVFSRTLHSFPSHRVGFRKGLECKYGEDKGGDFSEKGGNIKCGTRMKRLAVFVSGGGSNFRSIHEASLKGFVNGEIVVLVTNKHGCGGAEYARVEGIPVILFPSSKDEPGGLCPADLVTALRKFEVDFILLAGYLKLVPDELVRSYPRSILNIHPSLLPAFGGKGYYGMKVHKAVIASGARFSGPTIHFVDEHYDTGRILAQRVVPVLANDTADDLAARVLREEHKLYVEVTAALCEERIIWREDGVPIIQSKENPKAYS